MQTESLELSFLSIFALICFFIFFIIQKTSNIVGNGILLDKDFEKPQAFHNEPIARIGGLASVLSLMIFFIGYYLFFEKILFEYLTISLALFFLGFLDDIKVRITPNIRLISMIIILSLSIIFFSIDIIHLDLDFLNIWFQNKMFKTAFILLCFLFIINGANLVDGFNGLLGFQLIIINLILFFISLNSLNTELTLLISGQIIILFSFILFNFPKAKMFLGDSGSYLLGSLTVINVIKTNNLNPEISSFFFCVILFYLFFEVFFSFFRKLIFKKSPLKPDKLHLHMLLYDFMEKHKKFNDNNFITSVIINLSYSCLIFPAILFKGNGIICRYWFFFLLIVYLVIYFRLYSFTKK